jgi:DNA-binding NarL/FixJ family response regulator
MSDTLSKVKVITGVASRHRAAISLGVIDQKSFTRECIITSLQVLDDHLDIVSFTTCEDCLQGLGNLDVILYHAHEAVADLKGHNLVSLKRLLQAVPVIILSDHDGPDSIIEVFSSGARGLIPTTNTTVEQIIEIIGFVRAGGVFVPSSSLSLLQVKEQRVTERVMTSHQFSPIEMAVLDRLKVGKPNKIIAHELGVSESTVKVHIGRMMKKLKATNRTQLVSRAYALAADNAQSRDEARRAGFPGGDPAAASRR